MQIKIDQALFRKAMNKKVTIVAYHYVRELKFSRYPQIKGLDTALFKEQIAYIKKHYQVITMEQPIVSIDNNKALPDKALLLTFDDAYIDHFTQVFPVLVENKIQGSFFPPAKAIRDHTVLEVNKIHHILASNTEAARIKAEIFKLLDENRNEYGLDSNEFYYDQLAIADRFDTADVIFIKRLLQRGLPEKLRNRITDQLFEKFIGLSEPVFSRELYMTLDQIQMMHKAGMHIGSHGFDHYWLDSLPVEEQEQEIIKSMEFLQQIGVDISNWTMCYPYGGYDQLTIELLKKYNCKLALTVDLGIAEASTKNRFVLPRLDTNDLPKDSSAALNDWYQEG